MAAPVRRAVTPPESITASGSPCLASNNTTVLWIVGRPNTFGFSGKFALGLGGEVTARPDESGGFHVKAAARPVHAEHTGAERLAVRVEGKRLLHGGDAVRQRQQRVHVAAREHERHDDLRVVVAYRPSNSVKPFCSTA